MAILVGNRHLRLKVMLRDPKLWVNLILNVIGVRLRSMGTHFDHNRYIIRIFILGVFYRSLWSHAKVSDPLYTGVPKIFFRKLLFEFVVSNPFHVLEVGKKIKSKFFNLSPLPTLSYQSKECNDYQGTVFQILAVVYQCTILTYQIMPKTDLYTVPCSYCTNGTPVTAQEDTQFIFWWCLKPLLISKDISPSKNSWFWLFFFFFFFSFLNFSKLGPISEGFSTSEMADFARFFIFYFFIIFLPFLWNETIS